MRKDVALLDPMLVTRPWRVFEDNQSALAIMNFEGKYENRKHYAVRALWMRDLVESGVVKILYINTGDQVADQLTKSLAGPAVEKHRAVMLNEGVHEHLPRRCRLARHHCDIIRRSMAGC